MSPTIIAWICIAIGFFIAGVIVIVGGYVMYRMSEEDEEHPDG